MTDDERFAVVLDELGGVVVELKSVGLNEDVVLIGAQVVALEQEARAAPLFELQTSHGTTLTRPFSFEPDLAFDTDDEVKLEEVPAALRRRGFNRLHRAGRPSTWQKAVGEVTVELDLFTTAEAAQATGMVALRGADRLRSRPITLPDGVTVRVPDAVSFLAMKVEAKLNLRPGLTKDSYDVLAYVLAVGPGAVAKELKKAPAELRAKLQQLFGTAAAPGVRDVVTAGLPHGDAQEQALLAQFVVDTFATALG